MQCMEVWGGSQLTAQGVGFSGLDAWIYSKPHGEAQRGGDVYYASSCATGRITRLLLADVAGHGQAVASTAAELRTLMRQFVNRQDQTEFVSLLNRRFGALYEDGTYATALVTTFFAPKRRLSVCNAGHPRPLLYNAQRKEWSLLSHHPAPTRSRLSNTPLGMIALAEYEQLEVTLDPGDCLLCYTDALIESNDAEGEMLGESGVLEIVRSLGDPGSAEKIAGKLLDVIGGRFAGNLSDDDVTVLAVMANGGPTWHSPKTMLKSVARALSGESIHGG
jgi:sigma-B regulation protein RsbU (phosphoserine phosphatase)